MVSSITRMNIDRTRRDIASLREQDAREAKKASDAQSKLARISAELGRANASRAGSLSKDAERFNKDLASATDRRADIAKKVSDKHRDLDRYEKQLATEEERDRKQLADREVRDRKAREKRIRDLEARIASQQRQSVTDALTTVIAHESQPAAHDVFISHASEDKDDVVRALAEGLRSAGLDVWYDEFALRVGDSLRRKIDQGLASSRFGLVVLSPSFFAKEWPQRELDGLVQLEVAGRARILPIWHKVSRDEVARFSPTLADKVALNTTTMTVDKIAEELVRAMR